MIIKRYYLAFAILRFISIFQLRPSERALVCFSRLLLFMMKFFWLPGFNSMSLFCYFCSLYDAIGSVPIKPLIYWLFLRASLLSQICLGFHRTRTNSNLY